MNEVCGICEGIYEEYEERSQKYVGI